MLPARSIAVGLLFATLFGWPVSAVAQLRFRESRVFRGVSVEVDRDGAGSAASDSVSSAPRKTARSQGPLELPDKHGQYWEAYEIADYTARVTTTARPEQAIVDWILRETGTEVWFSEPAGMMTANRERLLVYHTREMHELVAGVVERFLAGGVEPESFVLRLVTVGSPNWRSKALPLMRSVPVESPGIEAWLLSSENAALLLSDLQKRTDFRDHRLPRLVLQNGQSHTMTRTRPQQYARNIRLREQGGPGFELEMGQIHEGFSLMISPLLSTDGTLDAVIKCHIDQVEKLIPVQMLVPGGGVAPQSVQIQVPQMVSWRLHERFRWPADQVLLLSCGVVASPAEDTTSPLSLPNLLTTTRGRADALLLIERRGTASRLPEPVEQPPARTARRLFPNLRGN